MSGRQKDEFDDRFAVAKRSRQEVQDDLRELYTYLFNGREREFDRGRRNSDLEDEIFDSTAAEANMDFTSDMFTYQTPATSPWVEYEAGSAVPEEAVEEVTEIIAVREDHMAAAFRSSNYYEVGKQIFQECGIGLVAANVTRPTFSSAISFEPVPISQLYITAGAMGLEDRFRERKLLLRDVKLLYPRYEPRRNAKDSDELPVCHGYWRDYSDPGNPQWRSWAKVDGKTAEDQTLGGPGSCPLQIGRFNPSAGCPWGRGPGWMLLPEIRTINALRQMVLNKMDQVVDPALVYVRDGLLDLSEGIEAGHAYAAMPGAAQEIREIGLEGNLDYGLFTLEEQERRIRRGFYRKPEQQGKTPPSATQFDGEQIEAMSRMGQDGSAVFSEFVRGILERVEFLEVRDRGLEQQILVAGDVVSVSPISPMVRAQSAQQVVTAQNILQVGTNTIGPEAMNMEIDLAGTLRTMSDKLGDEIVRFRSPQEKQQLLAAQQQPQGAPVA